MKNTLQELLFPLSHVIFSPLFFSEPQKYKLILWELI